jgi:hypothetical protein
MKDFCAIFPRNLENASDSTRMDLNEFCDIVNVAIVDGPGIRNGVVLKNFID